MCQPDGRSGKTVLTDEGPLRIEVPRDRAGSFEPQLIPKHERRFAGFDERIASMYARVTFVTRACCGTARTCYSRRWGATPGTGYDAEGTASFDPR